MMHIENPDHNKKQNLWRKIAEKQQGNTKENLQQTKQMKSEGFGKKIKQAVHKRIAKNKVSKQLHT